MDMNWLRKLRTGARYFATGWRLGADFRSRWVLATMLPRHLAASRLGVNSQHLWRVSLQLNRTPLAIRFRAQDIFIICEVLGTVGYMIPDILRMKPRCIIDLGAHIGLAAIRFKTAFPQAIIHCYEPDPDNFALLEENTRALEGVILHRVAVGSATGTALFYVLPHRHAGSTMVRPGSHESYRQTVCSTSALDDILRTTTDVDLVKFDIEGAERSVFAHSALVHQVPHIVGEMKADFAEVSAFVNLFPAHRGSIRSLSRRMHVIHLWRTPHGE